MQSEAPLPQSAASFTPPPGFEPPDPEGDSKKRRRKWLLVIMVTIFALLFIIALIVALLQGGGDTNTNQDSNSSSTNSTQQTSDTQQSNTQQDNGNCTETLRAYSNQDLGITFCYPQAWGDVSVQDARFAATDAGSRYRLIFSKKPEVNLGIVSGDWSTSVPRDGTCVDPASPLPSFTDFSTAWQKHPATGEVSEASRGIEVLADQYLITESADDLLTNGVCLRGYTVINGRAYDHTTASYYVAFNGDIQNTQAHIDAPNTLVPREERTDFAAFIKSIQAL